MYNSLKGRCIHFSKWPETEKLIKALTAYGWGEKMTERKFDGGEEFSFPMLKAGEFGLTFVRSVVIAGEHDYPEHDFSESGAVWVDVHATAVGYNEMTGEDFQRLQTNVKRWIVLQKDEQPRYMQFIRVQVNEKVNDVYNVTIKLRCRHYRVRHTLGPIVYSKLHRNIWDKQMKHVIKEGVCFSNTYVPEDLTKSLRKHLDEFASNTPVDFHPNSNDVVRDLVHPALYSFIRGVSMFKSGISGDEFVTTEGTKDFWGREYETSKFQWLPTKFRVTQEEKCNIEGDINNLDRKKFAQLYEDLENLFEVFVPFFAEVWTYSKAMTFNDPSYYNDPSNEPRLDITAKQKCLDTFAGCDLQVVTKVVEYELLPGKQYEGVWHVEGMSHENIVMTGIYFIDRDAPLEGGNLLFKRAFTKSEAYSMRSVAQIRAEVYNEFCDEGFLPLGQFPTEEGYMLVFPNCHVHKISTLINRHAEMTCRRRLVVFFVVNPDRQIVSTSEVKPLQGMISLEEAKRYRLELMSERKYDKQKMNVRRVELCEH